MKQVGKQIANHFGSKQGFLRYCLGQFDVYTRKYTKLNELKPAEVKRIVFVCSGNICRSPFGEFVSRQLGYDATSIGLHTDGGFPAFERTIEVADKLGYCLSSHVSTGMKSYRWSSTDLLVGMEPKHAVELRSFFPNSRIFLLGMALPSPTAYIHDPYNTDIAYFERCLRQIECATNRLVNKLND